MAKRRRKTNRKSKLFSLDFLFHRKGSRRKKGLFLDRFVTFAKVLGIICLLAIVPIAFVFITRYVEEAVPVSETTGVLELIDPPEWVNDRLKQMILEAAVEGGEDLKLDEDAARSVQRNVEKLAWLDEVMVVTGNESIRILAEWRKPIALVKFGSQKFFIDKDLVVLEHVGIGLPIVEIEGLVANRIPEAGQVWKLDDLEAAATILNQLNMWDQIQTADKPLLNEIERIDISNFNGRQDGRAAHIIIYTTDNTEIIWGAEYGSWQRYLESPDEEKLAKLYGYYKENGSLLGGVKFINLRDPQDRLTLPIDKY